MNHKSENNRIEAPYGNRREAFELSGGTAVYVDDLPLQGDWFGSTVRSTIAHGKWLGLEFDPSFDWSKVVVVTASDIPGRNIVVCHEPDQPCLCDGIVRHIHEPLALVAAPDINLLHQALKSIHPKYEIWPSVFNMEEAMKCQVRIFQENNRFQEIHIEKGSPEDAIANADFVIETTHHTPAQEHLYLETQGMHAEWTDSDHVTIRGSMQCPYYLVDGVASLMGIPANQVRVMAQQTGGGFGGKEDFPTMLAGHVALLSKKARKPVRMIYTRSEDMQSTTKRHPALIRRKTGLLKSGEIVGMIVELILDGGAYATLSPFVLSRAALHATGPYRCENVRIHATAVATNHPPNGGFRGFGCPQVHFAGESHIDICADRAGISPISFRRLNLLKPGDTMPTGQILGHDTTAGEVLERALQDSNYEHLGAKICNWNESAVSRTDETRFKRRGIGLALFMHGTGLNEYWESQVKSRVRLKGLTDGRVQVLTAQTEFGQGTLTTLGLIAAQTLGLKPDDVVVTQPDTEFAPDSGPTVASRTNSIVGSLIVQAATDLRNKIVEEFGDTSIADSKTLKQNIARYCHQKSLEIDVNYISPKCIEADDAWQPHDAYPAYTWSCCIAEVEADTLTGETSVVSLHTVQDVGHVIHPVLAAGQVRGGAAQGMGWCLFENVIWDNQGGMKNASVTDYAIPSSLDVPEISVTFLENPSERMLNGAKGLGELAMEGPAPAIANALKTITGKWFYQLPILSSNVLKAFEENSE